MNKNLKIRLLADSGMTLALLLLMSYQLVGEKAHEWIGMAMFLLVIGHHVLNRRWMGNITRGKYTVHRILQTVIVILLALMMIGSMVSGILLSNYIFRFVGSKGWPIWQGAFIFSVHTGDFCLLRCIWDFIGT